MKARPILFSAPMIGALLDGTKTQTRRVVKPAREPNFGAEMAPREIAGDVRKGNFDMCPYGQTGDLLWVRESFMPAPMEAPPEVARATRWNIAYAAGGQGIVMAPDSYNPMLYNYERWSPSIHMPRWASRLTLRITDVRVDRVQDISEADAIAEGIEQSGLNNVIGPAAAATLAKGSLAIDRFARLWQSINGPRDLGWYVNPWVWALTFEVIQKNVDQVLADPTPRTAP